MQTNQCGGVWWSDSGANVDLYGYGTQIMVYNYAPFNLEFQRYYTTSAAGGWETAVFGIGAHIFFTLFVAEQAYHSG